MHKHTIHNCSVCIEPNNLRDRWTRITNFHRTTDITFGYVNTLPANWSDPMATLRSRKTTKGGEAQCMQRQNVHHAGSVRRRVQTSVWRAVSLQLRDSSVSCSWRTPDSIKRSEAVDTARLLLHALHYRCSSCRRHPRSRHSLPFPSGAPQVVVPVVPREISWRQFQRTNGQRKRDSKHHQWKPLAVSKLREIPRKALGTVEHRCIWRIECCTLLKRRTRTFAVRRVSSGKRLLSSLATRY